MHYNRLLFFLLHLILVAVGMVAAQPVTATIDAKRTGPPITKLIFGGFMEPAASTGWLSFMGPQRRWVPIGADSIVTMDKTIPYVGEWSALVRLEAGKPHGISQSRIVLVGGKTYAGRVILAGTPGIKVDISLIWGPNANDRQTITIDRLTPAYAKFPLRFTPKSDSNEGRFEIAGTGQGSFHIGAASLMPADNVSGSKAATIRYLKEQRISIARWPGGNFVSAYDWRDGIGNHDKRPPRHDMAWNSTESNDMGIDDFMTFCRLIDRRELRIRR